LRQNRRENQNTFYVTFFENRTVYEIIRKSTAEPRRPQMIMWPMRFSCGTTKVIEYVLPFQGNNGYANMLQWNIVHTLLSC